MKVVINEAQAYEVFTLLLRLLKGRQYPYKNIKASLPQTLIPEEIRVSALTHALFLFYLTHMMRGRINSTTAAKELIRLWEDTPDIFDPLRVRQWSPMSLYLVFNRRIGLVSDLEIPRFWMENSSRLTFWGGDPREIFRGTTDANEVRRRLCNTKRRVRGLDARAEGLIGFQEKMASMLAYFLMDAGLIEPFIIAPAVDFHLMRVMVNTGVLEVPGHFKSPRAIARAGVSAIEWFCRKHGAGTVALGDALWLLSRNLCRHAPGFVLSWNQPKERRYLRTYGTCPVEHWCGRYVPSNQYYRRGVEGPREIAVVERSKPTLRQPFLFEGLVVQRAKARSPNDAG